jgi:hypothetical protein
MKLPGKTLMPCRNQMAPKSTRILPTMFKVIFMSLPVRGYDSPTPSGHPRAASGGWIFSIGGCVLRRRGDRHCTTPSYLIEYASRPTSSGDRGCRGGHLQNRSDLSRVTRLLVIDSGRANASVYELVPSVPSCPDQKNSSPIAIKDDFREGLPAARGLLSLLSSLPWTRKVRVAIWSGLDSGDFANSKPLRSASRNQDRSCPQCPHCVRSTGATANTNVYRVVPGVPTKNHKSTS